MVAAGGKGTPLYASPRASAPVPRAHALSRCALARLTRAACAPAPAPGFDGEQRRKVEATMDDVYVRFKQVRWARQGLAAWRARQQVRQQAGAGRPAGALLKRRSCAMLQGWPSSAPRLPLRGWAVAPGRRWWRRGAA